jgi:hypothetical protein
MDKEKYISPFIKKERCYFRYSIIRQSVAIIFPPLSMQSKYWTGTETGNKRFKTKEKAMQETDKELVDRGYILLTQEQWDKLIILV